MTEPEKNKPDLSGYYILTDTDFEWTAKDEGAPIILFALDPEDAVRQASLLEQSLPHNKNTDWEIQWKVAKLELSGYQHVEHIAGEFYGQPFLNIKENGNVEG